MRGRKPKPTGLRILEGVPGHKPLNTREPKPLEGDLSPPKWLKGPARKEWKRIVAVMPPGIITLADLIPFAIYCSLSGEFIQDELDGKRMQTLRLTELRAYAVEFGLTPSARARMVVPLVKHDNNDEKSDYFKTA